MQGAGGARLNSEVSVGSSAMRNGMSLSIIIYFNRTSWRIEYIETGLPARSAKIYALQNARELCYEG